MHGRLGIRFPEWALHVEDFGPACAGTTTLDILRIMQRCPDLQVLDVDCLSAPLPEELELDLFGVVIDASKLRLTRLRASASQLRFFLEHTSTLHSRCSFITTVDDEDARIEVPRIQALLQPLIDDIKLWSAPLRFLDAQSITNDESVLTMDSDADAASKVSEKNYHPVFHLRIVRAEDTFYEQPPFLTGLLASAPLSDVDSFAMRGFSAVNASITLGLHMIRRCGVLRTLILHGPVSAVLMNTLVRRYNSVYGSRKGRVNEPPDEEMSDSDDNDTLRALSQLQDIHLEATPLGRNQRTESLDTTWLGAWLVQRYQNEGPPLATLTFKESVCAGTLSNHLTWLARLTDTRISWDSARSGDSSSQH